MLNVAKLGEVDAIEVLASKVGRVGKRCESLGFIISLGIMRCNEDK